MISLNTSAAAVGNVRIGATGTASVTINNVGDGNQAGAGLDNLTGTVAAGSGGFSGAGGSFNLSDSGSQTFSYTVSPTAHGPLATSLAVNAADGSTNGTNSPQNLTVTLSSCYGRRPGALYQPCARQHVEPQPAGAFEAMAVGNATSDANLGSLTNLDILSASLSGASSSMFSLSGISNGTVLAKSQSSNLQISFAPTSNFSGTAAATLTLVTDQGAANGVAGKTVSFQLDGIAGPSGFYWRGGHGGAWNSTSPGYNWVVASGSTFRSRRRCRPPATTSSSPTPIPQLPIRRSDRICR